LQPGEILYTETAEIVCEACSPARRSVPGGLSWGEALERRRRAYHRRWLLSGIVFGWIVAGLFVAWRVHGRTTVATIDAPGPRAVVGATAFVRGRVVSVGMPQPLWLVARSPDRCPSDPFLAARVVTAPDGSWESAVRLPGAPGQQFLLTIVAADELADAALERATEDASRRAAAPNSDGPCRPLPGGWLDLPAGSTPLASREVTWSGALAARQTPQAPSN
jgi:hypothetical protein